MSHFRIWKSYRFEAAHSLPHLPEGHKCRNLHGHSYRVEVETTGPLDPKNSWVRDYAEFNPAMRNLIDNRLDHQNLNDLFERTPGFQGVPTTAEMLALYILQRMPKWVTAVRVFETPDTGVEVRAAEESG